MGKKGKRAQKEAGPAASPKRRRGGGPRRRWTLGHLTVALVLGLVLGGALGYAAGERAGSAPVIDSTGQEIEPQSRRDRFGRSPGHPHYGHDHS